MRNFFASVCIALGSFKSHTKWKIYHCKYKLKTNEVKNLSKKWFAMLVGSHFLKKIKRLVVDIKGALSRLRQFLATESPLKMMKNTFYFTLKALFVSIVLTFWSCAKTA